MSITIYFSVFVNIFRKEVVSRKEGKREGSKDNFYSVKVFGLGWGRVEFEGWLRRGLGKVGCFGIKVFILRNFLMILRFEGGV